MAKKEPKPVVIKWKKKGGLAIETNDCEATILAAMKAGWTRQKAPAKKD